MDDADLVELKVSPGKFTPKFNKNVTEYSMTLASDVAKITFQCMASDTGASYQILGSGGSKTIPLTEGEVNVIKIEVTAEDGSSTKIYQVNAKRLSAKDASLMGLQLSSGSIDPEFNPDTLKYNSFVAFTLSSITVKPTAPDKKMVVKVNGGDVGTAIPLNIGETYIDVAVTSTDGSNTQVYNLVVTKKRLNRAVRFMDLKQSMKYECPICLGALYCPTTIKGSDPKHTFCFPCINELTRTSKFDPLDETPLELEWKIAEHGLDKEMSSAMVHSIYAYMGAEEKVKFCELGTDAKESRHKPKDLEEEADTCSDCSKKIAKGEMEWHKAKLCTSKFTDRDSKHKVQVRNWEKRLQQVLNESNVDKLVQNSKDQLKQYKENLPRHGQAGSYSEGHSPIDALMTASHNIASAIKIKSKQADLHYQLGLILEEQYYALDMYGLKKESDDVDDSFGALSLGSKHESSEEEDIRALCQQRGVGANAPLSRILQAIDEELKYLKETGQSSKADYVQTLHMLKAKQATQDGKAAQAASNEETPLGQAYLKYMDAVSLNQNSAIYNVHAGRLLLLQGKVDEAIDRLQVAVGLKPTMTIARLYLGLAIASQSSGAGTRSKEAIAYLHDGVQYLLQRCTMNAMSEDDNIDGPSVHSEDLWRKSNVQLLRGCIQLGKLLSSTPQDKCMTAEEIFHSAGILAADNICSLVNRGDIYQSMEWILLDSHSNLLQLLMTKKCDPMWIAERCQRLSALIRSFTIPQSTQILQLQEKTCQTGVLIHPCNSHSLYLLGNAQLAMHENNPSSDSGKISAQDAQLSFRASIDMEGKSITGGDPPQQLTKQEWWQKVKKEEEDKKIAEEKAKQKAAPAGAAKGVTAPAGRGAAAGGRGGAATRGGRGTPAARGGAAATRGGVAARGAARGGPAAARGGPAARGGGRGAATAAKPAAGKAVPPAKTAPAKASPAQKPEEKVEPVKEEKAKEEVPSNVPRNKMMYQARLGLARVLAKEGVDADEAHMLYNDVITMAPGVHDAYIELGDILVKKDPLQAVDIYAKFPFPEGDSSFDDAYIHGEIVRLLMKAEKFDDPRLEKHMIAWGRVMGIGALEKYVDILDSKFKSQILMNIYAGVNRKTVDDSDMQAFFKFKMWL